MQQTCIDNILMGNYTELNDTASLVNETRRAVDTVVSYKCEPFDCNANGRCVNGTCVCNAGTISLQSFLAFAHSSEVGAIADFKSPPRTVPLPVK